jgi:putative CRISPR-associated protein (TIGR02619 family)
MSNQKLVLATAGTSIAGVVRWSGDPGAWGRDVRARLANLPQETSEFLTAASGELNSLNRMGLDKGDLVALLLTDTDDGQAAGEIVAELIREHLGCDVTTVPVAGLQVQDERRFRRDGVPRLFTEIEALRHAHPQRDAVLNATGGFKGVVPYLTLYGLLESLPVVYLFERTEALLHLPPAPVSFDWDLLHSAADAFQKLREEGVMDEAHFWKLAVGVPFEQRDRYAALLEADEGMVAPSALAELAFRHWHREERSVLLSPKASAALREAGADKRRRVEANLARVHDPTWRAAKLHAFPACQLLILKPGNTAERLGVFLQGDRVYVAEIWTDHDVYQAEAPRLSPEDYDRADFKPWVQTSPQGTVRISEAVEAEELRGRLAKLEAAIVHAEAEWSSEVARSEELDAALSVALADREELEARVAHAEQRAQAAEAEALRPVTSEPRGLLGWLRRVFRGQ